ncbi:MAG: panthothenate synthetase [Bacteroidetes bacterium]|nr:panthothenate synthetase [Bacteroidota bacterium]
MRYLVHIMVPHEPFNSYVRDGSAGQKIGRILEETKPEAIYFTEEDGTRGATAVYNIDSASDIPSIAEPWFLTFEADCRFRIAMSPEDLQNSGLDELGQKWG